MARGSIPRRVKPERYVLVPPEGGWGYVVTIALSLIFIVTVVPTAAFGIVFGSFLAQLGDETGGTTLINGVFNTVLCFTGLAANQLLQRYSCRKVGLLGSFFFFIGTFGTIFVNSVFQMILTFGVLQGIGFGLLMPSGFGAFHSYFKEKQNVTMGVCQVIIVAVTIGWPALTETLMETYGWRGTAAIFSALSLNCFLAVFTFQPAKWHYKKQLISVTELDQVAAQKHQTDADNNMKTIVEGKLFHEGKSEFTENDGKIIMEGEPLLDEKDFLNGDGHDQVLKSKTVSISSLNGFVGSVTNLNVETTALNAEKLGLWKSIVKSYDLGLFKDPMYVNIAFGLSLGMTSDLAFISILPLLLVNYGFGPSEITQLMTIYFVADLISRILLSVVSAVTKVWNRYVFLAGALLSAIFRIAFVMNSSFWWIASVSAILGFLRCFIQTPLPLVVAEQYGPRFTTAFTLYMLVCGVVALSVAVLSGVVKQLTQSDTMVVHLLTVAYSLCAIPWGLEIIITKLRRKN